MIQAIALAKMYGEDCTGHALLGKFDLVAANSGGALVVAALIENKTLGEICTMFRDTSMLEKLFMKLPFYKQFLWGIGGIGPRFSTEAKANQIAALLPKSRDKPLDQLAIKGCHEGNVDLLFMTYHYDRERASMQRSNKNSLAGNFTSSGSSPTLAAVVNASSTAPVQWFDEPATIGKDRYWDGGVSGYNNPCLAAMVEAIANGVPREQIAVLSIGTGGILLPIAEKGETSALFKPRTEPGTTNDIKKAATSILQDPPDAHSFIAHLMMGGTLSSSAANCPYAPTRFVRLNPMIQPKMQDDEWVTPKGESKSEVCKLGKHGYGSL
jgi:uncharacterized protein